MPWVETTSPSFSARHELDDDADVVEVLELLESTRERLGSVFERLPDDISVVIHGSPVQLDLAQPYVPLIRRMTAPAARRYLVGWFSAGEIHVLAPRLLRSRASNVPGSLEMNLLAPAALYTQIVIGANNPGLPPPFRPGTFGRYLRWAWLSAGAAQYFSGQTPHARPAIGRRLHEGPRPAFPPGIRDAMLLGGTVIDLVAREEGDDAAVRLACRRPRGTARDALLETFHGRPLVHTEGAWRSHLARLAGHA